MKLRNNNIGIIGIGNMGSAILRCLSQSDFAKFKDKSIWIYDKDFSKCKQLQKETDVNITSSAAELTEKCGIVILAVKPLHVAEVLSEIVDLLTRDHLILSVAAGISIAQLKNMMKNKCYVIRAMPNTPALIGEGMTAICYDSSIPNEYITMACEILRFCGKVEIISEEQIHGATAISGSSPAYVYMILEALADGGVMFGLSREISYKMAAQALLGAAKMLLQTKKHPGVLKDMVCSPGGTTIEAVASLEKNGLRGTIIEAVRACAEKSITMEKGSNKDN